MKRYLLAFTVSCIVVLLQGAPTRNYDSLFFLHAAELHQAGEGMRNLSGYDWINPDMYFSDAPFTLWAPGYSWLLARGLDMGISWQVWGSLINAVSLGVLSVCVLWILRSTPLFIQSLALILLLSSTAFIHTYSYLLSDMVFVCVVFCSAVTLEYYLSQRCSVPLPTVSTGAAFSLQGRL